MLTIVDVGFDAVVTLETRDEVPVVEVACMRCDFQLEMIAFVPVPGTDAVVAMAHSLVAQHCTASHPDATR